MNPRERIGLYVHIPFCVRKCGYCDFLSFRADVETQKDYVNALCKQIDAAGDKRPVASVYFGGGTPSVPDPSLIEQILCKLKEQFRFLPDAEITIEVNPKTVRDGALPYYRKMGFNRLSIGLQSANEAEMKLLGRIHTYDDFLKTYRNAQEAGFTNLNVDLMTALPGQDAGTLQHTLDEIVRLNPTHVSAYSLILEEHTPFYERYANTPDALPSEETERALYRQTCEFLGAHGYGHYEISNFAKPGYESRHNSACWRREEYLGFGLGAASLYEGKRFCCHKDLSDYLRDPCGRIEETVLTKQDCMEEFMFLGLRLLEGVYEDGFYETFHAPIDEIYAKPLMKLTQEGLLERKEGRIFLTPQGIDWGNHVFSCFLL